MDAVAVFFANRIWHQARFEWGWFADPVLIPDPAVTSLMIVLLTGFWLVVFTFFGLYRERYASSRFDELVTIVKVVTVGIPGAGEIVFAYATDPEGNIIEVQQWSERQ